MSKKMKKFFSYYGPYKKLLVADLFCALIIAIVSLTIPLCVRYVTNDLLVKSSTIPMNEVINIALFMALLILIEFVCNYFVTYKGHLMGVYMESDMRSDLFTHYQRLSFNFYDNQKTGILLSRLTNDLNTLAELYHHGPEDIVISLIKSVGAFIILVQINPTLTCIVFTVLPIMFIFAKLCNKRMKAAFRLNKQRIGEINARVEDNLSGIRVVKSFANEKKELEKFGVENQNFVESKDFTYRAMANFNSGLNAFITTITVIIIVFGSLIISSGVIIVGDLLTFLLYINNLTEPIKKIINFTEQYQQGITGFDRFMEIMETDPDIKDKKGAQPLKDVKGSVQFKNVDFKYESSTENVLSNINLDVKAGEYIALVGSSGSGKTTLCSLIPRFYDITNGEILIDNQNIKDVTLSSLRTSIGIVQQDIYLFSGTIMDNIRYGKPNATDEEIILAAKQANAHEFISDLEDGYYTDIGQRGVKLSGGQKQRLSIARVFLKNPPILIFDEATSALDNESEKVVQDSLEKLAKGRTTFVIAHRLSTIRNAERIVVLSEDGIVEEGSHHNLIKKDGLYAHLYNIQFDIN